MRERLWDAGYGWERQRGACVHVHQFSTATKRSAAAGFLCSSVAGTGALLQQIGTKVKVNGDGCEEVIFGPCLILCTS